MRVVLGAAGLALGGYGGWLLVAGSTRSDLLEVAAWLVAGVLLHDLVLAPLVVALAWVGGRLLPAPARGPAAVGLVVLGSVTLLAVPVLGRFGAVPGDPTHLDRDYTAGWLALAAVVAVGVVAAAFVVRSRARRSDVTGARSR